MGNVTMYDVPVVTISISLPSYSNQSAFFKNAANWLVWSLIKLTNYSNCYLSLWCWWAGLFFCAIFSAGFSYFENATWKTLSPLMAKWYIDICNIINYRYIKFNCAFQVKDFDFVWITVITCGEEFSERMPKCSLKPFSVSGVCWKCLEMHLVSAIRWSYV